DRFAAERALVSTLTETLRVQPDQLVPRVERLVQQLKQAEKQIAALQSAELLANANSLVDRARDGAGVRLLATELPGTAGGDLRSLATDLRERLGTAPGVVALVGGSGEKAAAVVAVNAAAQGLGVHAGQLISLASGHLGGK